MIGMLKGIWDWLAGLPAWLLAVVIAAFTSMSDLGKDILCWFIDDAFVLVEVILNSIPANVVNFDPAPYFSALPADLVNAASYIHLPAALGLIVAALGIRFVLQLIPFVRLGS